MVKTNDNNNDSNSNIKAKFNNNAQHNTMAP
jgi:hypothetical protein